MLLDEPSFGLAPLMVRELFAILRDINAARAASACCWSSRTRRWRSSSPTTPTCIETGRVVLSGSAADDLKRNDAVRRAYLGY